MPCSQTSPSWARANESRKLHLALPERLDLAADQHDPGLVGTEDLVVVARAAVLGHQRPPVDLLRGHRPIKGSFVSVLLLAGPFGTASSPTASTGSPSKHAGSWPAARARCSRSTRPPTLPSSARLYTVEPRDVLRADRAAEAAGWDLIGVWHSHTHTLAYPSPTDIEQAPDPDWHYVLVSLSDVEPVVRSYRIVDRAGPGGTRQHRGLTRLEGTSTGRCPTMVIGKVGFGPAASLGRRWHVGSGCDGRSAPAEHPAPHGRQGSPS